MHPLHQQLTAQINAHAPIACVNLGAMMAAVPFDSLKTGSALVIQGDSATLAIKGLLVPHTDADYSPSGITAYNQLANHIDRAQAAGVKRLTLQVDSNGGFVKGLAALRQKLLDSPMHITSNIDGSAYSAAYWLASVADTITATKDSGIGSIGVYIEHQEVAIAQKQAGITTSIFKSGFWKGAFSAFNPLSNREKARLQDSVNEQAQIFFDDVATARGLSKQAIADLEGDTFTAQKAQELGLIDSVQTQPTIRSSTMTTDVNTRFAAEQDALAAQKAEFAAEKAAFLQQKQHLQDELAAAVQALAAHKDKQRAMQIDQLAIKIDDDKRAIFAQMSDEAFALVLDLLDKAKPALPNALQTEVLQGKAAACVDKFDAYAKS